MSDTWSNIQAHKKQLDSLRERLQRRRKDPGQLSTGTFIPMTSCRSGPVETIFEPSAFFRYLLNRGDKFSPNSLVKPAYIVRRKHIEHLEIPACTGKNPFRSEVLDVTLDWSRFDSILCMRANSKYSSIYTVIRDKNSFFKRHTKI